MANRYWVGGTASWDGTAGSKWATTDGGAGGSAIPTSADDVFFTAKPAPTWAATTAYSLAAIVSPVTGNGYFYECTTAGTTAGTEPTWPTVVGNTVTDGTVVWTCRASTVTIAAGNTGAKTLNCTGFTGTLAGADAFNVYGNVTLVAGMTVTYNATMIFNATATLVSAGKTLGSITVAITGITVTLGDAYSTTIGSITVTAGTFDTANYNVTAVALNSNNTNTRTINLGSSTLTLSSTVVAINFATATNLTFNAGTSQINCTGDGADIFCGAGRTFYNMSFTSTGGSPHEFQGAGTNTFNNLTFTAPATSGVKQISFAANQTISGTLTASGASALRRLSIRSDTLRTARTLTVATYAPSDCDFRDITIAGAASPISGTRLGDCLNNTNITFDAPKTVYWNPAAGADFFSASWAVSSGSTTLSADNLPLAQDTAIVDQNSRAAFNSVQSNMNVGELDMSNRTTALTVALGGVQWNLYKNLKLGTGITTSGANPVVFSGTSTQTITSNGRTLTGGITINAPSSTVELADAINCGSGITLTAGTFDAKTYNVTAATATISGTTTRSLKMGSGTWTLTGTAAVWTATTTTGLTFDKGTANIVLSNTSTSARTFAGGGLTYNKLTIGGTTGTSTLTISGSNTFSELASTKTVAHTITFTAGTTTTVGAWTITGTSGNVVTLQSSTTSSYTLTKTGGGTVSCDYMSISRSTATPGSTWYAGNNSTDGGNNSGWTFTAPPTGATSNMLFLFT